MALLADHASTKEQCLCMSDSCRTYMRISERVVVVSVHVRYELSDHKPCYSRQRLGCQLGKCLYSRSLLKITVFVDRVMVVGITVGSCPVLWWQQWYTNNHNGI